MVGLPAYDMTARRSNTLNTVPGRPARQKFTAASSRAHVNAHALVPEPAPAAPDRRALSDAKLTTLSSRDEDALYGTGAGQQGGATGKEDAFRSYLHDISGLSLLSQDEELIIAKRSAAGDLRARRRLVEANLRLVVAIARSYISAGVPLIDLIQEGNLGLMHAAEKFDWRFGCRFGTYAGWWIRQAIRRATDEQSRLIHLPERVATRMHKVRRIAWRLLQEYGEEPSVEQIAEAAGIPVDEVNDLRHLAEQPFSLDTSPEAHDGVPLAEVLEDPGAQAPPDVVSQHSLSEELYQALRQLPQRERSIIMLRFGIGDGRARALREIGHELRISRERVRQIEAQALERLRHASAAQSLHASLRPASGHL